MKAIARILTAGLALLALACTGGEKQAGKPFEELPVIQQDQLWSFFEAIKADLPEYLQSEENLKSYRIQHEEMQDGALGDGEGYSEPWYSSENCIFWSEYLILPDDYDWSTEEDNAEHPYATLDGYMNPDGTRIYGILRSGVYSNEGDKENPVKCYWYDIASGKVSPAEFLVDKPVTADMLGEDALLHYGADNLYYSLKNGKFSNNYYDRGFEVYIEDVGDSGVRYDWDGTQFKQVERKHQMALFGYGFSNIMLGENMPFSIPGYSIDPVEGDNPYEHIFDVKKEGESEPTLVFHTNSSYELYEIEICTDRYASVYNIYPGMPYTQFKDIVDEMGSWYEEAPYISIIDDMDEDFVIIYCGFDEEFYYKVAKKDYIGNQMFKPTAKIDRVVATHAVG